MQANKKNYLQCMFLFKNEIVYYSRLKRNIFQRHVANKKFKSNGTKEDIFIFKD